MANKIWGGSGDGSPARRRSRRTEDSNLIEQGDAIARRLSRWIGELGRALRDSRPDALYVWAYEGQVGTAEACDDPERAWAEACVVLREGTDVTLIANGILAHRALEAAQSLSGRGISARVLNMSTVKPLDREAIVDAARATRGIVTAEEAFASGGLGSAVAEVLAVEHPAPMRILGVPDTFAPTGQTEFLLEHFGLNAKGIETAARQLMGAEV